MRFRGRIKSGRVEAWRAALEHLRRHRGLVAQGVGAIAFGVVVVNLPFIPGSEYARGAATAALVVAFLWILSWFTWVTSGLAFRIQGTFAEDAVTETLAKSRYVFDVVPSLKVGGRDVDQVAVVRGGVLAVETKWRVQRPSDEQVRREAEGAASMARTLRLQLRALDTNGLPGALVHPVLVVCGPGREGLASHVVETTLGSVAVVNGGEIDEWLARFSSGLVGPDFAERIAADLHRLARQRDDAAVSAGPLLRWLARGG